MIVWNAQTFLVEFFLLGTVLDAGKQSVCVAKSEQKDEGLQKMNRQVSTDNEEWERKDVWRMETVSQFHHEHVYPATPMPVSSLLQSLMRMPPLGFEVLLVCRFQHQVTSCGVLWWYEDLIGKPLQTTFNQQVENVMKVNSYPTGVPVESM